MAWKTEIGPRFSETGCPDLDIPSCLTCPLPRCRYDEDDAYALLKGLTHERNEAVLQVFHEERLSAQELAQRFNLAKRTIHRILQEAKK